VKLIVGLGNPGPRYVLTRHNVGALAVDELARRHPSHPLGVRCHSTVYAGKIAGQFVLLAKPLTYMNTSGKAVGPLLRAYHLNPASLVVIHDDIDLPPGRIKEKHRGGHAGHRGLTSVIDAVGTDEFCRIRVGVGRPPEGTSATDYVLAPLGEETLSELASAVATVADRVSEILARR
jgi:PTH1 family peptidyl-tRNA hydrolase